MQPTATTFGAAVSACEKGMQWAQSLLLLSETASLRLGLGVVEYTAALHTCQKRGWWELSLSLLREMKCNKVEPNVVSCIAALGVCEQSGQWSWCPELLRAVFNRSVVASCEEDEGEQERRPAETWVPIVQALLLAVGVLHRYSFLGQTFLRTFRRNVQAPAVTGLHELSEVEPASHRAAGGRILDARISGTFSFEAHFGREALSELQLRDKEHSIGVRPASGSASRRGVVARTSANRSRYGCTHFAERAPEVPGQQVQAWRTRARHLHRHI